MLICQTRSQLINFTLIWLTRCQTFQWWSKSCIWMMRKSWISLFMFINKKQILFSLLQLQLDWMLHLLFLDWLDSTQIQRIYIIKLQIKWFNISMTQKKRSWDMKMKIMKHVCLSVSMTSHLQIICWITRALRNI